MSTTEITTSAARAAGQVHSQTVVTYQSPRGNSLRVCTRCLDADVRLPRDYDGQEYCTVSHGRHRGHCDLSAHEEDLAEDLKWAKNQTEKPTE